MNTSHARRLLDHYDSRVTATFPGAPVSRKPDAVIPILGEAGHLRWMIAETRGALEQGRLDRAARWLGFIEGTLVQLGLATLEDIQMLDVESSFPVA
jgi:hypothetical protein